MRRLIFQPFLEQGKLPTLENVHFVALGILNRAVVLAEVTA